MNLNIWKVDARQFFECLDDNSVKCICTSPPYFDQRDYGIRGQIGLRKTGPEAYVDTIVAIMCSALPKMKSDGGVLWLNIGDKVSSPVDVPAWGVKKGDMMGLPWRIAMELQRKGWHLKSDLIWGKGNPPPVSINRPSPAHEYFFLFSTRGGASEKDTCYNPRTAKIVAKTRAGTPMAVVGGKKYANSYYGVNNSSTVSSGTARRRSVVFDGGDCAPQETDELVKEAIKKAKEWRKEAQAKHVAPFPPQIIAPLIAHTTDEGDLVVDPFAGSGTTGVVSQLMKRRFIGGDIFLNK